MSNSNTSGSKAVHSEEFVSRVKQWTEGGISVCLCVGVFDALSPELFSCLQSAADEFDRIACFALDREVLETKRSLENRKQSVAGLPLVDLASGGTIDDLQALLHDTPIKALYLCDVALPEELVLNDSVSIVSVVTSEGSIVSEIVASTESQFGLRAAHALEGPELPFQPAVFLDRDGTLIKHVTHLHEPEKVEFFPDGLACLKHLQDAGFRLVIVTNQAGIGLGYFTKEDFYSVNLVILKEATRVGVLFDKIYFSPYNKRDDTECRKPKPGMVMRAVQELNLDLENSFVVGDTTTDMQLAHSIDCPGILVKTGSGGKDGMYEASAEVVVDGLNEAVNYILQKSGRQSV